MQVDCYSDNSRGFSKSLPIKSLLYYMQGILQIFLSYKLQQYGYHAYFYAFWAIFGFDKLITLMIGITHRKSMYFYLTDLLQVGFFYIIFSDYQSQEMQNVFTMKYYSNIFLILVLQIIFYFGLGMLFEYNLEEYVVILLYGAFIFTIVFFLLLLIDITNVEYSLSYHLKFIISFGANLLCISSFLISRDWQGNCLGYYLLGLIGLDFLVLFTWNTFENSFCCETLNKSLKETYYCQVINIYEIYEKNQRISSLCVKNIQNLDYANKIFTSGLLLSCSISVSNGNIFTQQSFQAQDVIKIAQIILTILIIFANLIYFADQLYQNIFKYISLHIYTPKGLNKAIKKLRKNKISTERITIYLYNSSDEFNESEVSQIKSPFILSKCNLFCKQHYKLLKLTSQYLEKNVEVNLFDSLNKLCRCCSIQIMSQERCFVDIFLQNPYFYNQSLPHILLSRYINGYSQTIETKKLEKIGKLKQNESHFFRQISSDMLKIFTYEIIIKPHMIYSPSQILYDLYGY